LKGIETLVERLQPIDCHYAGLLEPLIEWVLEPVEEQAAASVT
jgi:hypothetical protein